MLSYLYVRIQCVACHTEDGTCDTKITDGFSSVRTIHYRHHKVHQHYVVQGLLLVLLRRRHLLLHFLYSYLSVLSLLTRVSCGSQVAEGGL